MITTELFKDGIEYEIENEKYVFHKLESSDIEDGLDKLKNKLKKFTKFYYWLIQVISPVFVDNNQNYLYLHM